MVQMHALLMTVSCFLMIFTSTVGAKGGKAFDLRVCPDMNFKVTEKDGASYMSLKDSTYKEAFLHLQFPGLDLAQEISEAVTLISIEQFTLVS